MIPAMVKASRYQRLRTRGSQCSTLTSKYIELHCNVLWENEAKFHNFYLRLGGMHLLMSYCGCIGTLMADIGIVETLSVAFGGVLKMLSGKKFPQNVRALRMLVKELLRPPLFGKNIFHNMDDLLQEWDAISVESKTSQRWVDSLIKPIVAILKYIRTE